MTKRFFQVDHDELYYICDKQMIPKYPDYFTEDEINEWYVEHSLSGTEVVGELNEQQAQINAQANVIGEYQKRCDNEFQENQRIKRIIKDMMENERTEIGKSVLNQLWEAIQ